MFFNSDNYFQLVPQMVRRLKQLQDIGLSESVPRPSAILSYKNSNGVAKEGSSSKFEKQQFTSEPLEKVKTPCERSPEEMENECSSSSAEAESNCIGLMSIYPADLISRQVFTLRYLAAIGGYEEVNSYKLGI